MRRVRYGIGSHLCEGCPARQGRTTRPGAHDGFEAGGLFDSYKFNSKRTRDWAVPISLRRERQGVAFHL